MAAYDLADLRRRVRDRRRRPTGDADLSNTIIDGYLTDAQLYVYGLLASHFPGGGPLRATAVKMTTSDAGATYVLPSTPLLGRIVIHNNVRLNSKISDSEYFWEGNTTLRWKQGENRSFADGPYAVYVVTPGAIGTSNAVPTTEPSLTPDYLRLLLVEWACALDASSGNQESAVPYETQFNKLFFGGRFPGDLGYLGMLKQQYQGTGAQDTSHWWRSPDLSRFSP
jgi:hypothetical protein